MYLTFVVLQAVGEKAVILKDGGKRLRNSKGMGVEGRAFWNSEGTGGR